MKHSDVCVLLPAFNEAKTLPRLVKQIQMLGFPVIVSDDASADGTVEESRRSGAEVLTADENQGKGMAVRRGFEWFLKKNYQALILMDADGQHDPSELDAFVKALDEGADLVVGNRMHAPQNMPFVRRATNRLLYWMLSALSKCRVPDSQCGYRAIRREALAKLSFRTSRFEIESEMLIEAARAKLAIRSIPIRSLYTSEKSGIRPVLDTLRFFRFLFETFFFNKK